MDYHCPVCGKAIPSATSEADGSRQMNAIFFPFCCQRCRLLDLGNWLDGNYRVPTATRDSEDELLEDL